MLGATGPIGDAVTAADAALDRCRSMADAGQARAALANAKQAVRLYRQLADDHPDIYLPDLALSLQTMSDMAALSGQHDDGLTAAHEAVAIFRELSSADDSDDADSAALFVPYLGSALCTLAARLHESSDDESALTTVREGIHLFDNAPRDDLRRHRTALDAARLLRNELSPDEHLLDEEFDHRGAHQY